MQGLVAFALDNSLLLFLGAAAAVIWAKALLSLVAAPLAVAVAWLSGVRPLARTSPKTI